MSIEVIENQIETLVSEVVDIKAVYDYPVVELGRKLPALIVIYDGFEQGFEAVKQTETTYRFEFTLYFAAEGKKLKSVWDAVKTVSKAILDKFRSNPTLNDTVYQSIIRRGNTMIEAADRPRWLGHTFVLEARKIE